MHSFRALDLERGDGERATELNERAVSTDAGPVGQTG